jgi:hypothetical protein
MARKAAKPADRTGVKLTLTISAELATRLYGLARSQGCGKAELAARLLEQGCRRFGQDKALRAMAAELGAGEAGAIDRA